MSKPSCPICRKLGKELFVDFDRGEDLPPEARRLATVIAGPANSLKQCPLCQTYYSSTYTLDNDIFQHSEEIRMTRIPPKDAAKEIRNEKKSRKTRKADGT